nr:T9SS type A sorting domain-containing protein [candidate division Zixibacteria bacterium]
MSSKLLIIITNLILLAGLALNAVAQEPQPGPLLPENNQELPPRTGYRPPRVNLSHLTGQYAVGKIAEGPVPERWDWREQGRVTPVKNQGSCGSCYAFASIANVESRIYIDDTVAYDLSENNAKECNFYDRSCDGGNFYDMACLYSQKGTVLESCDPYSASDVSCNTGCEYVATLLDWNIICAGTAASTATLKDIIYNYGPVYTTLYAGNGDAWGSDYNVYDGSYTLYYDGTEATNHAVLIVGWDDTLTHAGGTGGWIVKNSWGTGWGGTCGYGTEGGYFKIAYGSAGIGQYSSFCSDWQEYDETGEILYYDEAGFSNYWGYGSTTGWGMCKFQPAADFDLARVEFWTTDITTDIDIYVYDSYNPGTRTLSDLLTQKLNVSYDYAGYHSVALDSIFEITSGNDFYVAVKITNSSFNYPIVADQDGTNETGTTFLSSNGSNGSWTDMGVSYGDDIAIRVRTGTILVLDADDNQNPVPNHCGLGQNHPNPFNAATTISYSLENRSKVEISVFNILGQNIRNLVDEVKAAGNYTVIWDGRDASGRGVATGIYFYQLIAGDYIETRKMILLK